MTRSFRFGLFTAAAALVLAGCSSTPQTPPPAAAPAPAPSTAAAPAAPQATPAKTDSGAVATVSLPPYLDPKNPLSTERSVFFAFDDYTVGTQYAPLLERHGKFLATTPSVRVKIEGFADERGSAEYNLALGQRRAQAVVNALKIYGVPEGQMEAVSWGEERPAAAGHDEESWARNRRADVTYPSR